MTFAFKELIRHKPAGVVLSEMEISESSPLNKLAALAAATSGYETAAITLYEGDTKICVGSYNCSAKSWKRSGLDRAMTKDVHFIADFDKQFPKSPMANGQLGSFVSAAVARIKLQDEIVGGLWIYSVKPTPSLPDNVTETLKEIASLAGAFIYTKAELKLTLANVFSLANR